MRRAARTDGNHRAIIDTLRACGWYVLDLSAAGKGCPDCLAARGGRLVLIEIKDGSKAPSARRLTVPELSVHQGFAAAGVQVLIIESVEEALAILG